MSETLEVPVIDISAWLAEESGAGDLPGLIDSICRDLGFFVITGHGISPDVISDMRGACLSFFALRDEVKVGYQPPPGQHVGYLYKEGLSYSRGDASPPDLKETYTCNRIDVPAEDPYFHTAEAKPYFTPNVWPDEVSGFAEAWGRYYAAVDDLAIRLMRLMAVALGLPVNQFDPFVDRAISSMRALYYPALRVEALAGQLRAGAHTDFGSLTVLLTDDAPGGLQVLHRRGSWLAVPHVPGALIVNIGDLLAQWTNDRWVSSVHRVVTPEVGPGTDRLSVAFFNQPNYDALVEALATCCGPDNPPRYEPVTSGEHLFRKVLLQREMASSS